MAAAVAAAVAATAVAADGNAARQAEVLGAVASHPATLYRSTMESIATN